MAVLRGVPRLQVTPGSPFGCSAGTKPPRAGVNPETRPRRLQAVCPRVIFSLLRAVLCAGAAPCVEPRALHASRAPREQLGAAAALPGALRERAFNSACDTEKEPAASGNWGWFFTAGASGDNCELISGMPFDNLVKSGTLAPAGGELPEAPLGLGGLSPCPRGAAWGSPAFPGAFGGAGVPPSLPLAFCKEFPIPYALQNGVTPFRWAQAVEARPGSALPRHTEHGESPAGRALKPSWARRCRPNRERGGREAFRFANREILLQPGEAAGKPQDRGARTPAQISCRKPRRRRAEPRERRALGGASAGVLLL